MADASGGLAQFDGALGGDIDLPSTVLLREFGESRMEEILMLSEKLNEPPHRGQLFQRLPKYMRRRQMSHFVSRLPRRVQAQVDSQNNLVPSKRPSRKYRRKPKSLLAEYSRRKRTKIWLETHIWHAKRFHMVDKWGYKLAESATDKSFRSNYRAIRSHSLLLDMSYMACIQIVGEESSILNGLSKCTSEKCGLTFAARMTLDGSREGCVAVFHPDSYPLRAIGNVSFLWRPALAQGLRTLWIWVHPLVHDELVQCISQVFHIEKSESLPLPTWRSNQNSIVVTSLKDMLNRYRLIGPLSSCILAEALPVSSPPPPVHSLDTSVVVLDELSEVTDEPTAKKLKMDTEAKPDEALQSVYASESWREACSQQKSVMKRMEECAPAQYPRGVVLGLLIQDPRLFSPSARQKSKPTVYNKTTVEWMDSLALSAIWDDKVRDLVRKRLPTDFDVNQQRASLVVPSAAGCLSSAAIPLLLVHQQGSSSSHLGFGAGWDVIVPGGCGLPVWRSLVLRGARAGGLRETKLSGLEVGSLRHTLAPDSEAGRAESCVAERALRERHFRLPPAKRPNFIKLGVYAPFSPPWHQISEGNVVVVRDRALLSRLAKALTSKQVEVEADLEENALVPIKVHCLAGRPETLARIHLPLPGDLALKKIEEPIHPDGKSDLRAKRKKLREKLLKKWKKNRKLEKKGEAVNWDKEESARIRKNWAETDEAMWLLDAPIENVRSVVGCVTVADFAFSEGRGVALGFITLAGLRQTIQHYPMKALPTNLSSMSTNIKRKILVTRKDFPAVSLLSDFDVDVWDDCCYMPREELLKRCAGKEAIIVTHMDRVDDELLDAAGPQLKVVATPSVGYDNIDIDALKRRNVRLGNTPGVSDDAVAEHTIALTLCCMRRLFEGRDAVASGAWPQFLQFFWMNGSGLKDSIVGIVGLGRIGLEVAKRLTAFKVKEIVYTSRHEKPEAHKFNGRMVELAELLCICDVVIVVTVLCPDTHHLIGHNQFSLMKPTAVIVNVARGDVLDQQALVRALSDGVIAGAALDVTSPEPLPPNHPLLKLPNCCIVPHLGSAILSTRKAMAELTASNVLAALEENVMPAEVI